MVAGGGGGVGGWRGQGGGGGGRVGEGSWCLMETVSVWEDENVLEMEDGDGCTTTWMYSRPLKNG